MADPTDPTQPPQAAAHPRPDGPKPDRRRPPRGYAYGRYLGGPDPLAPPLDLRDALDRIGADVMAGTSPRQALRELLRQGDGTRRGLDELARKLWRRRRQLQRDNRIDGTLQRVRELLDEALTAERSQLGRQDDDESRFAEMVLDALPDDTAGAVRELDTHAWQSADARASFAEIRELLGRELLEQRFTGMKQALQHASRGDVDRVRQMVDDLNDLLAAHARGDDATAQFDRFMADYDQFFPERPRTVDELIDTLAGRSAAAERLRAQLSPEQRAELADLSQQAFGDARLGRSLDRLDSQLQQLRPGADWSGTGPPGRFRGNNPLGLGEATRLMEELAQIDALADQLGQQYPGAALDDIDLDLLSDQLGDQARVDVRALAELERELREQGLLERAPDGSLRLSPQALRRLGATALRDVVDRIGARRGERDTRRSGAAGEPTGATRPWAFGDTEAWQVPRTLLNAQLRRAGGDRRLLDVSDIAVIETEQRARAAVALCVDTSWSMVQDGRWVPMKRTALALHQLISTRFRSDALQLITFGRQAAKVELGELIGLEGTYVQGTNLHHALLLAGQHLGKHPDARPVVMVVTDGEPTAHLEPDGAASFSYPPEPRTVRATVAELDRLTGRQAAITFFVLGEDPKLATFVDGLARRCRGRVVAPDLDGLGAEVVADYLRTRR